MAKSGWVPIDALSWATVEIAGARPAVRLARLSGSEGATLLVRFPPGWERPGDGHYEVIEEVLFLVGSFEMTGERYEAGDHTWFPARYPRSATRSPSGALAWAWFSGRNDWIEGPAAGHGQSLPRATRRRWTDQEPVAIAGLGRDVRGRELVTTGRRDCYLVDELPPGAVVGSELRATELFDLSTHACAVVPAGEPLPESPAGPVLVHLVS